MFDFLIVTEESRPFHDCYIVLLRSSCVFMHVPDYLNNTCKRKLSLALGSDPIDEQFTEFL